MALSMVPPAYRLVHPFTDDFFAIAYYSEELLSSSRSLPPPPCLLIMEREIREYCYFKSRGFPELFLTRRFLGRCHIDLCHIRLPATKWDVCHSTCCHQQRPKKAQRESFTPPSLCMVPLYQVHARMAIQAALDTSKSHELLGDKHFIYT